MESAGEGSWKVPEKERGDETRDWLLDSIQEAGVGGDERRA